MTKKKKAELKGEEQSVVGIELTDFYALMTSKEYMFIPTREMWPGSNINARIDGVPLLDKNGKPICNEEGKPKLMKPSDWLTINRPVDQITWAPGLPMKIDDMIIDDGGWIKQPGKAVFNRYRPPIIEPGDAKQATPWVMHVMKVYPKEGKHIMDYFAHIVQLPEEKPNHALVLGGPPGVGKDTILEPVKRGVGAWNWAEVSPKHLLGNFNPFARNVVIRINEARDQGEVRRDQFYDMVKIYEAAPPDVLPVNEKYEPPYYAPNICRVIYTTNYTTSLYLPANDRRHLVAWTNAREEEFDKDYWDGIWGWYEAGGIWHVVAFLNERDISSFNAKAPPIKTEAFWETVNVNRAPEEAELADVIDALGNPDAVTISDITIQLIKTLAKERGGHYQDVIARKSDEELLAYTLEERDLPRNSLLSWIVDRKSRRSMPHRMQSCGYSPCRNKAAQDGYWKIGDRRHPIYTKAELSESAALVAADALVRKGNAKANRAKIAIVSKAGSGGEEEK